MLASLSLPNYFALSADICIMALINTTNLLAVFPIGLCIAALLVSSFKGRDYPRLKLGASIDLVSRVSPERRKFAEICQQAMPVCQLNPLLLSSGHLHTIWNLVKAGRTPRCHFYRILIEQEDSRYPGSFAIDFFDSGQDRQTARPASATSNPRPHFSIMNQEQKQKLAKEDVRPMLIILPGLGGGSAEDYIQETCHTMIGKSNWEIAVVIPRGCSGTTLTSKLFYHAGSTWDLAQAVTWLAATFPNRPMYALGFSLGANILTNVGAYCM